MSDTTIIGIMMQDRNALAEGIAFIENKVDFGNSTNLFIAATTLIIGIADMTWKRGDYSFGGIINGTLVAVIGYQVLRSLNKAAGKAE